MHTLLPRTWLRNDRLGICLVVIASIFCLPLSAVDEKPKVTLQFLDAETNAPLAGARIVIDAREIDRHMSIGLSLPSDPLSEPKPFPMPPGAPPMPATEYRGITDAKGFATTPVPAPNSGIAVLHEKGVAWLRHGEWKGSDHAAPILVKLQPWARLEGRVLRAGRPYAGALIVVSRQMQHVFMGSTVSFYAPPLLHGASAVTDADGRFVFDRLLPTSVDGDRDVPYLLSQIVRSEDAPKPVVGQESTAYYGPFGMAFPAESGEFTISVGRGTVSLQQGQRGEAELEALQRCVRQVSGRFVRADGKPFRPSHETPEQTWPSFTPLLTRSEITSSSGGDPIHEDGRFSTKLPLAGRWGLRLDSQQFIGGASEFEFNLPPCEDDRETGPPVDLGDIVLQAQFAPSKAKSPAAVAVDGNYDTSLRATDAAGKTLNAVTATITHLKSISESGSRNHYPKGLAAVTPSEDGLLHLQVPTVYHARNDGTEPAGMVWDVTHAEVKLECPGYETLIVSVATGSRTVVAMKPMASCSVRVTKEGKPIAHRQLHVAAGWQPYMDSSDFSKWKEDVATRTITRAGVPPGRWQVQTAHLASDGWRWFSDAREIEIDVAGGGVVELPLKRGALLEGRIADDVPRPVRHGMARVLVLMSEPDNSKGTRIYWSDWQLLDDAGHFSFKGLPTGETWFAASCEGWISSKWQRSAQNAFTPSGRTHYAESISTGWSCQPVIFLSDLRDHVVPMTRTGSCVLRFILEDGTPVKGVSASWDAGLTCGTSMYQNLGSADRALDDLLRSPGYGGYANGAFLPGPAQKTNANGALQVLNLPPGIARFSVRIDNRSLQLADPAKLPSMHPHDLYAPFQVLIRSGETVRGEFVGAIR